MLLIVLVVAIPFALLGELVVDHPAFWDKLMPRRWFPAHWTSHRGRR